MKSLILEGDKSAIATSKNDAFLRANLHLSFFGKTGNRIFSAFYYARGIRIRNIGRNS